MDQSSNNAVERCYEMAKVRDMDVFAVQKGWCGGLKKGKGYMRYGRSKDCINGTGGKLANSVYRIGMLYILIHHNFDQSMIGFVELQKSIAFRIVVARIGNIAG